MQEIISARNLSLAYERNEVVINSVNLDIYANDFVFITGKSGSGKSTLLKSFYGEISPLAGELNVCDYSTVFYKLNHLLRRPLQRRG